MKLGKVFDNDFCMKFNEALNALLEKPIPGKTAHKIGRILTQFDVEMKDAYKTRSRFVDQYGNKNADGTLVKDEKGNIPFTKDNWTLYSTAVTSLADFEIEFPQIALAELGENEFAGKYMLILSDIIKIEEEEKEIVASVKNIDLPPAVPMPVVAPAADPVIASDPASQPFPAADAPVASDAEAPVKNDAAVDVQVNTDVNMTGHTP